MEHLADEFIRRRRSIVVGRGRRYPESLRQLAVGFATEAGSRGWSGNRIAQRLGVAWATLERWCVMHSQRFSRLRCARSWCAMTHHCRPSCIVSPRPAPRIRAR